MKLRRVARLALMVIPVAGAAAPLTVSHLATAIPPVTIVVGTFTDTGSDCSPAGSGTSTCSLRTAVILANSHNNGDTIQLGAGTYNLTIAAVPKGNDNGVDGDLEVTGNMTIQGAGATQTIIQGVGAAAPWGDRIIELEDRSAAPTVTIRNLKVTGGNANVNTNNSFPEGDGGGIFNSHGNLTIHNVIVDGNTSDSDGGGVASSTGSAQTFTISNSTLSNNTAAGNGGGLWVGGTTTAVDSASNLFITNNTANGANLADAGGGGIYNDLVDASGTGSISFSDIMVVGNHAPGMGGGGVYDNANLSTPASLPLRRPVAYQRITLASNDARRFGGGFYSAASDAIVTNATITKNSVVNNIVLTVVGNGGGIAAGLVSHITVNNATINGNHSPGPGGGAASLASGDQIHLHNTILVKNTSGTGSSDCLKTGVIDSTGYNIVDDNTCVLAGTADRQATGLDPNLGGLQDNTGPLDGAPGDTSPTLTEALLTDSIAIDTADPAAANNPATDERGVSRPQGTASDVGAYEAIPPVAPVLPAAGHVGSGPRSSTLWLLLILAAATALAAAGLGVRARS